MSYSQLQNIKSPQEATKFVKQLEAQDPAGLRFFARAGILAKAKRAKKSIKGRERWETRMQALVASGDMKLTDTKIHPVTGLTVNVYTPTEKYMKTDDYQKRYAYINAVKAIAAYNDKFKDPKDKPARWKYGSMVPMAHRFDDPVSGKTVVRLAPLANLLMNAADLDGAKGRGIPGTWKPYTKVYNKATKKMEKKEGDPISIVWVQPKPPKSVKVDNSHRLEAVADTGVKFTPRIRKATT